MGVIRAMEGGYHPGTVRLLVEFHRRLAEEHEIRWDNRDRPIDAEDRDLDLVTGLDGIGDDDPVRDVKALDRGRRAPRRSSRPCVSTGRQTPPCRPPSTGPPHTLAAGPGRVAGETWAATAGPMRRVLTEQWPAWCRRQAWQDRDFSWFVLPFPM